MFKFKQLPTCFANTISKPLVNMFVTGNNLSVVLFLFVVFHSRTTSQKNRIISLIFMNNNVQYTEVI